MHERNVVHRDIKSDNILIDLNGEAKFTDFSISSLIEKEDKFSKTEGNLYFYPPELCTGKEKMFAAKPIDVWALGVNLFICIFHRLPFIPDNPSNILDLFKIIGNNE